jgi:outer membrane lipoprotein-sorting protein
MRGGCVIFIAILLSACAQVATEQAPLSVSSEARCAEFTRISNDMTTTAYRRATAVEQLRAQRCPGYQ